MGRPSRWSTSRAHASSRRAYHVALCRNRLIRSHWRKHLNRGMGSGAQSRRARRNQRYGSNQRELLAEPRHPSHREPYVAAKKRRWGEACGRVALGGKALGLGKRPVEAPRRRRRLDRSGRCRPRGGRQEQPARAARAARAARDARHPRTATARV